MSKLVSLFLSIFAFPIITRDARFTIGISPIDTLRIFLLRLSGAKIARNTYIRSNFFITYPQFFTLGSNSVSPQLLTMFIFLSYNWRLCSDWI